MDDWIFPLIISAIVIVAIALISLVMTLTAKPKGKDLAYLDSGHPSEHLIDYCVSNIRLNGLWIGGRTFLTTHRLVFMPNGLNRATQSGLTTIALDLRDISELNEHFGIGTRVIEMRTPRGLFKMRSWKTQAFAAAIEAARQAQLRA